MAQENKLKDADSGKGEGGGEDSALRLWQYRAVNHDRKTAFEGGRKVSCSWTSKCNFN